MENEYLLMFRIEMIGEEAMFMLTEIIPIIFFLFFIISAITICVVVTKTIIKYHKDVLKLRTEKNQLLFEIKDQLKRINDEKERQ